MYGRRMQEAYRRTGCKFIMVVMRPPAACNSEISLLYKSPGLARRANIVPALQKAAGRAATMPLQL